MNYRNFTILAGAAIGFAVGLKVSLNSFEGKTTARLYVSGRVVADSAQAVKQPLLMNKRLLREENIIESLAIVRRNDLGVIGIQFGNYITPYGQTLCSAFSKIEMILFGDNVATSGEHPKMILSGDCPGRVIARENAYSPKIQEVFPVLMLEDCESNTQIKDQIQLTNGTNTKVINLDVGVREPDWIIEKLSFIDENNALNTLEFNHVEIKEILNSGRNPSFRENIVINCE